MTDQPPAGYTRSGEAERERLDRHWNELLQELRLAQTGTQILFAFLLSIAFTNRFQDADRFTHDVFAGTLIASALAMGLFLAPVSFHRIVFQRRLRDRMIPIAHHLATGGLAFLLLAIGGGVLLALDVVLSRTAAIVTVAIVFAWFVGFWYILPAYVRRTSGNDLGGDLLEDVLRAGVDAFGAGPVGDDVGEAEFGGAADDVLEGADTAQRVAGGVQGQVPVERPALQYVVHPVAEIADRAEPGLEVVRLQADCHPAGAVPGREAQ